MKLLTSILIVISVFANTISVSFAYDDVPGQYNADSYIRLMREGVPMKIHDQIYDGVGQQKIKFKDFVPEDLGNQFSKNKNLEYIELKYQTMLRVLKENDSTNPKLTKLSSLLDTQWTELVVLFPLIKSNEGASSDNNPSNNNQGLYQLYGYEQFRNGGCGGNNPYYTSCSVANTLYSAGKKLSEYEQYQQLADFVMFLNYKALGQDGKIFGNGESSLAQNLNYAFQSLGMQTSVDECAKLVGAFNKKDFTLSNGSASSDFFAKNMMELSKLGFTKAEDTAKVISMYYLSARLLSYNGFRFGTNYLDNPYVASLYAPKSGDPRICMSQCANDGCTKINVKKGNGAMYFYYDLVGDGVGKKAFVSLLTSMKDGGRLENSVTCP